MTQTVTKEAKPKKPNGQSRETKVRKPKTQTIPQQEEVQKKTQQAFQEQKKEQEARPFKKVHIRLWKFFNLSKKTGLFGAVLIVSVLCYVLSFIAYIWVNVAAQTVLLSKLPINVAIVWFFLIMGTVFLLVFVILFVGPVKKEVKRYWDKYTWISHIINPSTGEDYTIIDEYLVDKDRSRIQFFPYDKVSRQEFDTVCEEMTAQGYTDYQTIQRIVDEKLFPESSNKKAKSNKNGNGAKKEEMPYFAYVGKFWRGFTNIIGHHREFPFFGYAEIDSISAHIRNVDIENRTIIGYAFSDEKKLTEAVLLRDYGLSKEEFLERISHMRPVSDFAASDKAVEIFQKSAASSANLMGEVTEVVNVQTGQTRLEKKHGIKQGVRKWNWQLIVILGLAITLVITLLVLAAHW
nr:hypothetical protein [Candidatus Freyarchaeota archaeon]